MASSASIVSLLESLGVPILQEVADAALGQGVLTLSDDASGLTVGVTLSSGQSLHADDVTFMGSQGFSGHFYVDGLDANPLSATLAGGFAIALTAFDVTIANGGMAASTIGGALTIPFFTDENGNPETLDVEVSTKQDGSLCITLAATTSSPTTPDGLVQLVYNLPGGLGSVEIDVASIEFDESAGTWTIIISGNLIITVPGLNWPSIELRGLGIDSKGNISLQGGWINLPNQMALDFYGFSIALQALGFGSDASGKWIGFNGDINLVEGLSLGGSVQGLKVNLTTGSISFNGVGISFEIPGVITIDGEIDHIHVDANTPNDLVPYGLMPSIFNSIAPVGPTGPKSIDLFAGSVKVQVLPDEMDLEVDANFIVGNFGGQSVFFLALDVELPVGIPIFMDVSLYGLSGLVATGLDPDPEPNDTWWQWYKYPAGTSGPQLNATPDYSATDFTKWLVPQQGAFAIGGGCTIGTSADDGYTVSAAIMLVILMPGPVISLIGKANILSKRISGADQDANFEAMATYDGNSGTFDLTIDAQYSIPVVLDIEATAELYVDATAGEWFFAMGKPPHTQRVSARIFDIFETDAYFVVSNAGLITGTWTGYQGSWSFGPLSASLDAYLATLAAIQWSPLQIAGGIELHGSVQLSAFGIGVGISADALLEGCAPNPFWVHGELSVELDLPWPLPNVGGTISLSWGGDDGSIPPVPLALSHIDAALSDHGDSAGKPASDHYVLLAHRSNGPFPDLTVQYDNPQAPGILDLTGTALTNWQNRVSSGNLADMLPDMTPDNTSRTQMAPVLPQDTHFVLNFSHPVVDMSGGFNNALPQAQLPPEVVTTPPPPPPTEVGKDDMSNINPNPPSVQFLIRHSLIDVSLYEWVGGAWSLVASIPPVPPTEASAQADTTYLSGVWLAPTSATQIQLKVVPWMMVEGEFWTVSWSSTSTPQNYGTSFNNQGLDFQTTNTQPAAIGTGNAPGLQQGLAFTNAGGSQQPSVAITFPQPEVLSSLTAVVAVDEGELLYAYNAPTCVGDGVTLTPTAQSWDSNFMQWTLTFDPEATPISTLTLSMQNTSGATLVLYALDYTVPPTAMAILPKAPATYALRVTTKIEAARVNGGTPQYQTAPDGSPIVEFAYFQTACGPGIAEIGASIPNTSGLPSTPTNTTPVPAEAANFPQLAVNCSTMQQPFTSFPLGGAIDDLTTYTQWSWPLNGAVTAYYGYDVNVEFCESYVNALYVAAGGRGIANSLHFRCVDRNQNHLLLQTLAIHVPSIPQQSALVATALTVPLPSVIQPSDQDGLLTLTGAQLAGLEKRALVKIDSNLQPDTAASLQNTAITNVSQLTGPGIQQLNPGIIGIILKERQEQEAAATARQLWFQPLAPQMQYTLDVVAGSWLGATSDFYPAAGAGTGSLEEIFSASDAISLLKDLENWYTAQAALTTLERVTFTTSRYATFSSQMSNAADQLAGVAGTAPLRHYNTSVDVNTWLADAANGYSAFTTAQTIYTQQRATLAGVVAQFDPRADDLAPGAPWPDNGNHALVTAREATSQAWQALQQTSVPVFDALIGALGRADLTSTQKPVAVPDTEMTLFLDPTGFDIRAILLESPEALPWQRIWQWIQLTPISPSSLGLKQIDVLWNSDNTRGLILPLGSPRGRYTLSITFQGNLGAEAPCITLNGLPVTEAATIGVLSLGAVIHKPRNL
ncbi:hypothetical protein [Silvibacterium dinghuense]|uniref:Uncharacterized protein n=1 Tax=Silvibacterium dinghuense TaxID=1560006 RepID=A0A4Q1SDR1_9BACT|nr:hypothetical protein [Silvibacterium dinghuense]RXS95201.1 hypothetical protein ESZ00_11390 [Silvibacterium dinghuense]GGH11493.1 hypothetical protein GCM10011586_30220 [Silvibacterium dinghuense]